MSEAGRFWAGGGFSGADRRAAEADAAFFGLALEAADRSFGLWAENLPALEAFFAVSNQWRVSPVFGGPPLWLGLDYAACRAAWDSAGIAITPELWAGFQTVEAAAKDALNSR
ncbi:DUF1799 domain-containing protein [Gemmobacter nanjingensis]|uniref:DUF1799 domain-containing protein n=1 Tax=Gemmobacter nanjingensis TaxID=488454 RepID=UPI001672AC4C|nr:DUF1799 domain-containing protein [Gemmobacter nanjingensis]